MIDSEKTLSLILDVGTELIRSGGETHRVEDTMYRLAYGFGFQDCNFWVVPSNIQATITTADGQILTQMRHVRSSGVTFLLLDRLNSLSRWACAVHPTEEAFEERLLQIRSTPPQRAWVTYLAGMIAGCSFGVFFGCDLLDTVTAAIGSLFVTFLIRRLSVKEGNPLILNFIVSFLVELFIILAVHFGLGDHTGYITVGVIMLLISGLGATNGLRDLVHLDTLSGVMNISVSFTGAIGIALGIALPIYLFRGWETVNEVTTLNPNELIQLISGTAACVGFALWFRVHGIKILFCAIGACLTWVIYLLVHRTPDSGFGATLAAAVFCGLYAQIMARINKTPATIFSTICIFPLIPGASLYYAMYGLVVKDAALSYGKGMDLLSTCFGIVLGFMVVEVANRYLWRHPH